MSHYTEVQTEFTDRDCLVKALQKMGYTVEVHEGAGAHLYGYQGDKRSQLANVIVRKRFINDSSNDYGWKFDPKTKKFVMIESEYDVRSKHLKTDQLKQIYAEEKLLKEARRRGFRIIKRETKGGKILMTLRRSF